MASFMALVTIPVYAGYFQMQDIPLFTEIHTIADQKTLDIYKFNDKVGNATTTCYVSIAVGSYNQAISCVK